MLFFFPRDYQDLTDRREIARARRGQAADRSAAWSRRSSCATPARGGCVLGVLVRVGGDHLRAVWFNQPFMRDQFRRRPAGDPFGQAEATRAGLGDGPSAGDHPRRRRGRRPAGGILPVYPLTEGLQQWQVRRIVRAALDGYAELLDEVFPDGVLGGPRPLAAGPGAAGDPLPRRVATVLDQARRRFVYQELFILQLALAVKRQQQHDQRQAPPLEATAKIDARIRRLFPFELTAGQEQAIAEIAADMARPVPMNRLLQGDVGSGKTVVAVYAMLLAVAHGYQAVLMAPTEDPRPAACPDARTAAGRQPGPPASS